MNIEGERTNNTTQWFVVYMKPLAKHKMPSNIKVPVQDCIGSYLIKTKSQLKHQQSKSSNEELLLFVLFVFVWLIEKVKGDHTKQDYVKISNLISHSFIVYFLSLMNQS
jgi:hypothetical protein